MTRKGWCKTSLLKQAFVLCSEFVGLAGRSARHGRARAWCFSLIFPFVLLLPMPSSADVTVTCEGRTFRISLQLLYRWPGGGDLGLFIKPDLTVREPLESCTFEALYRSFLSNPNIVVRHSNGERPRDVMTMKDGEIKWRRTDDYGAVALHGAMRIWLTIFNSPKASTGYRKT